MTNHEQAKAYMYKQGLLGTDILLTFLLRDNDRVMLNSNNKLYTPTDTIVKIPGFVTHIKSNAFRNNSIIEKVEFINQEKIIEIGIMAFDKCLSLKQIELPQNITQINAGTFDECAISRINITDKCKLIDYYAFANCKNLKIVEINRENSKLDRIEGFAFMDCKRLKYIELPKSIKHISKETFDGIEHKVIGMASKELIEEYKDKINKLELHEYDTISKEDIAKLKK